MDRPQPRSIAARIGTALMLTAAVLTAMPAVAGAWTTVTPEATKAATKTTTKATAKTAAKPRAGTTVRRQTLATTTLDRKPLAMGVSLIEGNTRQRDDDLAALDAFAARTGAMPASYSIWSDWGNTDSEFPATWLLRGLRERGVRPVIFWQPVGRDWRTAPERYAYSTIVAGDWDAYLTRWANDARAWGGRVIVRWAHEMNAPWFPWAIGKVGNTTENYKAAWRHVVTLVRGIAPNVRFMWAPNAPCGARCVAYSAIFPGDEYVSLVGFSSYNWSGDPSVSMVRMYRNTVSALMSVSRRRIVAAETGIKGPGSGRDRWLAEGYAGVYAAYPRMKGIIYFDIDMTFGGQPVWRLLASDDSLDSYSRLMSDPRFMGRM